MSLPDCPYNCNRSYQVYDPRVRKEVPCPYCVPKVKDMVDAGNVPTLGGGEATVSQAQGALTGITGEYNITTTALDWHAVLPTYAWSHLDAAKADELQKTVGQVISILSTVGEKLPNSYCFGLTEKGLPENLLGVFVAAALRGGKTVAPLVVAQDLAAVEAGYSKHVEMVNRLHSDDLTIVLLPFGTAKDAIESVKCLMEIRAVKGLPTIIVTTWSKTALSRLLSWKDSPCYSQAEGFFLTYADLREGRRRENWYIQGITGYSESAAEPPTADENTARAGYNFGDL